MPETYKVVRRFRDFHHKKRVVRRGLTLEEAQAHCRDPQTSSKTCTTRHGVQLTQRWGPWFDGYEVER